MQLKHYQESALAVLRHFLEEARMAGPKNAYEAITKEPEHAQRIGRYSGSYVAPLTELPNVPYVCLRLPTGGGKTILAAHAVQIARDAWMERDHPLVLWLTPTNIIRQQTADALKNNGHAYRQALDVAFDGHVRVFDIAEFTHIRPQDLRDNCCIVVGTIQTLRVTNTEGRKVYAHNENLAPHFANARHGMAGLETLEGGGVKFSFANLLHLHHPLMIVDEAHNAVTGLTRDMQARVSPCAIIEFTATPRPKSNILHSVTALELKREEMIKLPIRLHEHDSWQSAVTGAVAARAALAKSAQAEASYIRPIVLFQAQKKNQEVTVEVLKRHLLEVERVPERAVAVATGNQRQLDGIDLFDPQCPIEYVITVEALKEGWDCSFAYVFCSVSRIQSAQNMEQLFGRVLRMPYAKRRTAAALNRAYAYVSEPSAGAAAQALTDKLVSMGFEEEEAQANVQPGLPGVDEDGPLLDQPNRAQPTFRYALPYSPGTLSALNKIGGEQLMVRRSSGEEIEISAKGDLNEQLVAAINSVIPKADLEFLTAHIKRYRDEMEAHKSPAERGATFKAPGLVTEIQGSLELADTALLVEDHDWSLLSHPAKLEAPEFSIRETARSFEIDIDGRRVRHHFLNEQEQFALNVAVEGWTPEALVLWLDPQVRQQDISQGELLKWLRDLVYYLTQNRGMQVSALMRCKFPLARRIKGKLDAIRQQERKRAYQNSLFAPGAKVAVSFDAAFDFKAGMFQDTPRYAGRWRANKHFLGPDEIPDFDGVEGGEEMQCAQAIDSLSDVQHWIRNPSRHPESFWLPTVAGRFYPDFVAQMDDGRCFAIEYKGGHLAEGSDTHEKRLIGELWERQSKGKCLFLIVERLRGGSDMRGQLRKKLDSTATPFKDQ